MPPGPRTVSRTLASLVLALCVGNEAFARPPSAPGPQSETAPNEAASSRGPGSKDNDRLRGRIFDQMRAYRMWKITEELKIDEATAAKLFPLLSKFDERERELGRARGQAYRELRAMLALPNPDGPRLEALLDRMTTLRAQKNTLEAEKLAALRKVLPPAQMGRLLLLLPRLEEGFRRRMREAMGGSGENAEGERRFRKKSPSP